LDSVFPRFEGFSELSFQDGEYGFDFISLMVFFLIERLSDSSSIVSGYSFTFSVSDRDERARVESISDQFMDLFGVVSFVHNIEVRMSDPVALFQEFFGLRDIVNRVLGDLQTGDNLLISIYRDRSFQEPFSRFTGSPGIVVAGVRTREPGRIDSGTRYLLTPVIEHFHEPVE